MTKETVTLEQMKYISDRFGYGQNSIKTALDAIVQNSASRTNPLYSYQAPVNGQKRKSTVYSIHTEPEDGSVRIKDIEAQNKAELVDGQIRVRRVD